jgi:opacity protein-like surface antigen
MWALQFEVNGQLLDVSSFAGGVSVKRQFTPRSALRLGVGLSGRTADFSPDPINRPELDSTEDTYGTSLEAVYQRYLDPGAVINAYWGIGPVAGYSLRKSESSADSLHTESKNSSWRVGALVTLGAEWFFAKQMSVHAEYTASGGYNKFTSENQRTQLGQPLIYRKSESASWSFATGDFVRLGVSVYF